MDARPRCQHAADNFLDLPRILCLHGGGTNARIFRQQCRVLVHHLSGQFRFVFAEAPLSCARPGPDVTSVYANQGPFRSWFPMFEDEPFRTSQDVVDAILATLDDTMKADDLCGATGAWVALLGFSQGAKLAASLLLAQQNNRSLYPFPLPRAEFRFAVLLAGRGPLVSLKPEMNVPSGMVSAATLSTELRLPSFDTRSMDHVLRLPTVHVHGLKDPGIEQHRKLLQLYCEPTSVTVVEWDGTHRIPITTKDVAAIAHHISYQYQTTQ